MQVTISYKRAQDYLLLPDQPTVHRLSPGTETDATAATTAATTAAAAAPLLVLEDASLGWPHPPPAAPPASKSRSSSKSHLKRGALPDAGPRKLAGRVLPEAVQHGALNGGGGGAPAAAAGPVAATVTTALEGVSLTVRRGEMVAVVGTVGTGKSSLLAAACGECLVSRGRVRTAPRLAAVPQHPFIIAGSVLDNVLLGRALDKARLREVLQASALDTDLAALPLGELTEVGERGVTLSGGQQQRVALARALYGAPEPLLLDDPPLPPQPLATPVQPPCSPLAAACRSDSPLQPPYTALTLPLQARPSCCSSMIHSLLSTHTRRRAHTTRTPCTYHAHTMRIHAHTRAHHAHRSSRCPCTRSA